MSTGKTLECISPIDGSVYASRDVMTREQAAGKLNAASAAQREWCNRSLAAGARGLVDGHALLPAKTPGVALASPCCAIKALHDPSHTTSENSPEATDLTLLK